MTATLVRERNPRVSVYEGTYPKHLTVTVLLIDRSLGNRGCVAYKSFVICTEPQQFYVRMTKFRGKLILVVFGVRETKKYLVQTLILPLNFVFFT
jgi:hypothetical protein